MSSIITDRSKTTAFMTCFMHGARFFRYEMFLPGQTAEIKRSLDGFIILF